MKKIKFLFFLILLSSCNQYLGTVVTDYTPSKEVTEIFSNIQINDDNAEVDLGNIIYPKIINPEIKINNLEINDIISIDKKSVVKFINDKILISKDKNILEINNSNYKTNFEYKLNLNKDEYVLNFFNFKDKIYLITNNSRVFALDSEDISMLVNYDIYTNTLPIIFDDTLIIFSVFGEIYQINLNDNSIVKKTRIYTKPGITKKSSIFEDQTTLYYLYNTGTLITFNKDNSDFYENYILEDLNILSSLEIFKELVDTPFSFDNYLYFIDQSGKIALYNPVSSEIFWEIDINSSIIDYLFSDNGYLTILTFDKILTYTNEGEIISSYTHNKESPISIINIHKVMYLISEEGIASIDLNNKSEDSFYKNKFTSNLDIYYQDQNIYLKDDKSLFKLSE